MADAPVENRGHRRLASAMYLVIKSIVRLHGKIDVRAFEQTGYGIGLAMKRTESKLATPGKGSGRCRAEEGRRLAGDAAGRRDPRGGRRSAKEAGSGRRTVGVEERFRWPETHRRIVSGNRNGPGPGGLDCGLAVMRGKTYSSARRHGERKARRRVQLSSRNLRGQAERARTATASMRRLVKR